jgi:phosphomannomutase
MNNDSLGKINVKNNDVNVILKSLQKITSSKEHLNQIDSSLDMINGKIISEINTSSGFINDLTISNIGDQYVSFLKTNNIQNNSFLVVSDGNFDAKVFSQVFASYLKSNEIKVFFTSVNEISNFGANFSNLDTSFGGMVSFSLHRSHKNILSISFFNDQGALFSTNESISFNSNIYNTLDLNMNIYDEKIDVLPLFDVEKYIATLPKEKDLSNLSVSINNSYNMNSEIIQKYLSRNKILYNESKTRNPNLNKNIKKAIFSSIKRKHDVAISLLPGNNYFEMAIRHKKQYKFFNLNDLATIYLYYQTKYVKHDINFFENKYIVGDIGTSELISVMAKKNKIEMKQYQTFYSELYTNKDLSSDMFFATNGTNYFISNGQSNYISDPFYNLQIFLEMISFFKQEKKTLYDIMVEIIEEYGVFRHSTNEQIIDDITVKKFFNITAKDMKLAGQKIIRFEKINTNNNNIKIFKAILEDKTKVSFVHSKRTNLLKIYLSLNFIEKKQIEPTEHKKFKKIIPLDKNDNYMNLIVREKKILEAIKLFKDDYVKKTFN